MPLITMKELIGHAQAHQYAVGAYLRGVDAVRLAVATEVTRTLRLFGASGQGIGALASALAKNQAG